MYTLCVIDMQPHFGVKSGTPVTLNSEREIRKAIKDKAAIIYVEYHNCGNTLEDLTKITKKRFWLKPFPRVYTIAKTGDDGSMEIINQIRKSGLPDGYIKVIGVNTDCCVYRTIYGLKQDLPTATIEVVADACDSSWSPESHLRGLKSIKDLGCQVSNHP